jgi:hypothetical protein
MFRSVPLYRPYKEVTEDDLQSIEAKHAVRLPDSLRYWLASVGYGDLDDDLSFRSEWFNVIDRGELTSHVIFGQDTGGNFYSFGPDSGSICYICRSESVFAHIASDFCEFLTELERRDFKLEDWMSSLPTRPYDWGT